ncbi:hypothetical protein MtrunA17_Chr2g0279551 [Medicago truncatula]|uniref:Transmembrane protein n=1 Tax=Medicago truncatula TaxID=3880 RepID=A0A396J0Z3_MEDTR|nr:hypothetical protein MtrunA17_Chr2g0279551 [Medicago truncatula]
MAIFDIHIQILIFFSSSFMVSSSSLASFEVAEKRIYDIEGHDLDGDGAPLPTPKSLLKEPFVKMFLIFEKKSRFLQAANADLKWKFWDAGDAFGRSRFVKIDCKGLDPGDYKKLGSKHRNDFACVKVLIWVFYGYWFAKICVIHGVYACWLRKCHMRASNGYLFLRALFLSSSGTLTKS